MDVESIRIIETTQNVEQMVTALNHLDAFLSGDTLFSRNDINKKDNKIIKILFSKFSNIADNETYSDVMIIYFLLLNVL